MPKTTKIADDLVLKAAAVIVHGDLGSQTLADYLKSLLETLWQEGAGFNGKRPFGNSGWQHGVYTALVKAGLLEGKLDAENGYLDSVDDKKGDEIVLAVIKRFVIKC